MCWPLFHFLFAVPHSPIRWGISGGTKRPLLQLIEFGKCDFDQGKLRDRFVKLLSVPGCYVAGWFRPLLYSKYGFQFTFSFNFSVVDDAFEILDGVDQRSGRRECGTMALCDDGDRGKPTGLSIWRQTKWKKCDKQRRLGVRANGIYIPIYIRQFNLTTRLF